MAVAARPPRWGEIATVETAELTTRVNSPRARGAPRPTLRAVLDPMDLMLQIAPILAGDRPGILLRGVTVGGEIDMATVAQLRAAVAVAARAVHASPGVAVVFLLDLTYVRFMDSTALHALGAIHAEVSGRGWTLRVTPPVARGPRRLLLLAAIQGWLPRA